MANKMVLLSKKYGPVVLSILSVFGTIATAAEAVRVTPKALQLIEEDSKKNHDGDSKAYSKSEAIKSAWKCYIPAAALGVSTIACILGANALNKKQQAMLMSGYALVKNSYDDLKIKLRELYGEEIYNTVVDSIMKEKCDEIHISDSCNGTSLDFGEDFEPEITRTFYDSFSQRYFETTISKVIEAEYQLNRNFMFNGVISLNDFYEFLGLETTELGESLGWSNVNGDIYWIDFNHHKTILDDGMEVFVIDMVFEPSTEWLEDI